jgi:hypothetical protein
MEEQNIGGNYMLDDLDLEVLPERVKQQIENDDYILSEIPDYVLDDEDITEIRERRDNFMKLNDDKLDMENDRICKEIERKIDAEIKKELEAEFEPIKTLADEDRQRAKELIDLEPLIQKAVNTNIVSLEEVVYFIDYYEIFSLINRTKRRTINTLNEIDSLFVEDNGIEGIRSNVEKTLNINNSVLDLDFDYSKLKIDHTSTFLTSSITKYPANKVAVEVKQKDKKVQTARAAATVVNPELKNTFSGSKGRFQSLPKLPNKVNKLTNSIELFSDNKPVNLLTIRDNRREMIKPGFKSKNSDLFKLDTKKILSDEAMTKEELRKQFLEVLDIPKVFVEKDVDKGKKNTILRRIDDARNYFKNKM